MLVFVFGSTTFATATVLAVFMGGLALGSYLAGRKADQIKRPFLWYGILEGIIGVWALIAPWLFDAATPLYRIIWQNFHLAVWPFSIIRFCVALLILIIPTTCMGATLPLLAKFVTSSLEAVGKRIGSLYAANTLGAVGGAAIAGLYLLPGVGLMKTTMIAALINFALIVIVVITSRTLERSPGSVSANSAGDQSTDLQASTADHSGTAATATPVISRQVIAVMIAFATSGAVAMVYEVGWTRTLCMVIGSSTYAFTLMLTSFLLGIFLGSLLCARLIDKAKDPIAWLAVIQLLIGGASLFSMERFNSIPYWNLQLNAAFPNDPNMALNARFFIAASIMMPLTFFLGAVFPAAVKACVKDLSAVGRSVGSLYSANTVGAIVGAFLAGFVFVPLMGVEKSLIFVTVINILMGAGLLFMVDTMRSTVKITALVAALLCGGFLLLRPEVWDRELLVFAQTARRTLSQTHLFKSEQAWREAVYNHVKIIFYEDGASSSVAIIKSPVTGAISLVTNGHVDGSDHTDMSTQVVVAAAPIAASPEAKNIAVIGWGSGMSVDAARNMSQGNVTAIELEPAVVKTSPYFHHVNAAPEQDPRVKLEANDGRNYLLATDEKFDVIISEPSNPWQAGVCNLFTREYFKLCKDRLREGGVLGLWCQNAEVPTKNVLSILAAVHQIFPYCAVMRMNDQNIVCLASDAPIKVDFDRLAQMMKNKGVINDLKQAGINTAQDLMARFCVAPSDLDKLIGDTPANDDDTNRLEYDVGRTYENVDSIEANNELFSRFEPGLPGLLKETGKSPDQVTNQMCTIAKRAQLSGNWNVAESWLLGSLKVKPTAEAYRLLGICKFQTGQPQEAYKLWEQSLKTQPGYVETLQTLGLVQLDENRPKAREFFNQVIKSDPSNKVARFRIAQTYGPLLVSDVYADVAQEEPALVLQNLQPIADDSDFMEHHHGAIFLQAWAQYKTGKLTEALETAKKYARLEPSTTCANQLLGNIYRDLSRYPEALTCWKAMMIRAPKVVPLLVEKAQSFIAHKDTKSATSVLVAALTVAPLNSDALKLLATLKDREPEASRVHTNVEKLKETFAEGR